MSDVVIAGIGQYRWANIGYFAALAGSQSYSGGTQGRRRTQTQALYVGNLLAPTLSHQQNLGALIVDNTGLDGIELHYRGSRRIRRGGFPPGLPGVASGFIDVAMVVGVEKYTDMVGPQVEAPGETTDYDYEAVQA